jgi:hypothetical protein
MAGYPVARWGGGRGVVIFGIGQGLARSARFYLEPVDEGPGTADDAVRDQVARG